MRQNEKNKNDQTKLINPKKKKTRGGLGTFV